MTDHPSPDMIRGYANATLAPEVRQEIEAHLHGCETCLLAVEEWLSAQPMARSLRDILPADVLPPSLISSPASSPPEPPGELRSHPRYEVLSFIGTGGMGQVWKARHLLMNRIVALKVINPDFLRSFAVRERFVREVRATALLSHTNIVQAFDVEQVGDLNFLVMEFVEGTDLARLVREQGRLPVAKACGYARQTADGLQHANERGMLHRDVKPHNLMLTPEGRIKILDFGLSAILAEAEPAIPSDSPASTVPGGSVTRVGDGCGTPDHISPEQVRDARTVDTRSDIYSLGCTLYHLLAGAPPFPGGTGYSKIAGHLERTPPPIQNIRPDIPDALVALLERMLAKERRKRPATPAEVSNALEPFASGKTSTNQRRLWRRLAFLTAGIAGTGGAVAYSVLGRHQTIPATPVFAEPLLTLEGHTDAVHSIAFVPRTREALSCGEDRTVRHWSLETGALLHTFEGHGDWVSWVSRHPDGRQAISSGRRISTCFK